MAGLMGEHFEKIGAVQKTPEQLAKEVCTSKCWITMSGQPVPGVSFALLTNSGDSWQAAEKEAAEKAAAEAERQRQAAAAAAADPQVQNVLQNQELRAILMDPNIRNILQECTNPAVRNGVVSMPLGAQCVGNFVRSMCW